MPDGACVVRYDGKRGTVWRVKFRERPSAEFPDGRQVTETLGRADEGWTRRKAEAALRARLTDVERVGLRRPLPTTFATFAGKWLEEYPAAAGLKRSTVEGYRLIERVHLRPAFGALKVSAIDLARVKRYVADAANAGLAPRTINRQLNLLSAILKAAVEEDLTRANPVALLKRPRERRYDATILKPDEIDRVERAFGELAEAAEGEERAWREQARTIFLVVVAAGLRRGEVLGLRWRDVNLADPDGAVLQVRETFVMAGIDTRKSEAGKRTIALGPVLTEELWQHRRRTSYPGDDERVFGSPTKGTPFDVARYAKALRLALKRAGVERYMRPFHDGRHTSLTNSPAAGMPEMALMTRAGHSDFKTTQRYIDLAGQTFRAETDLAEQRILGGSSRKFRSKVDDPVPEEATAR